MSGRRCRKPSPPSAAISADDTVILFHLGQDGRVVAASGIGLGSAVARDVRLAEMLIARGAKPTAGELASPDIKLKSLLAQ